MSIQKWLLTLLVAGTILFTLGACSSAEAQPVLTTMTLNEALANGKPTLAEFGRGTCIPCKEMKPILEDVAVLYQGKVNVVSVQIDDNMDLTRANKITVIPTQICFDGAGKEVTRHIGVWYKEEIAVQLSSMGVK